MIKKILLLIVLTSTIIANTNFKIISDFPNETIWVKSLLTKSLKELNTMFLNPYTNLPKQIIVTIKRNSKLNSIRANASRNNNSINFTSNIWQKDKYRIWILVHELTNLLSSYYGTNSYPSDWWANGRSPFPEYISVKIMEKLGLKKEAIWRKKVHINKPDHKFYWDLDRRFGLSVFKRFFLLIKTNNINLSKIGKPWPSPDKNRSLTSLALLSIAAKKNLANLASHYKIGQKPKDWYKRHPEINFLTYRISKEEINTEISRILK